MFKYLIILFIIIVLVLFIYVYFNSCITCHYSDYCSKHCVYCTYHNYNHRRFIFNTCDYHKYIFRGLGGEN